jgi:AmiR/NasT family two-component response regulator
VIDNEGAVAVERMLAVTEATYQRRAQLQHALESRVAIEQAKGIVAERYEIDPEEAFLLIRKAARTHRVKIHDLVARVRPGRPMPSEIEAVRER